VIKYLRRFYQTIIHLHFMTKNFFFLILLSVSAGIFGCQSENTTPQKNNIHLNTNADVESVLSILYQQQAAEYRALCFQAYNIARQRIVDAKNNRNYKGKKFAVITDLDETALDNSASNAWLYLNDSTVNFPFLLQWWLKGVADSVPGSVSFFKYAYEQGIDIYYISNRADSDIVVRSTIRNMHNLGFPFTDDTDTNHFLFLKSGGSSSKKLRREKIEKIDSVLVFLGDNLIDLDSAFDGQPIDVRRKEVDRLKTKWGMNYIVFPNSIYGDWESKLYPPGLTKRQKDSLRASILRNVN